MLYLDTGCLLKLYYPEPESAKVAAMVSGEVIALTALHELEIVTAIHLKVFRGEAKPEQASAASALVREDVATGKLVEVEVNWRAAWREASNLAKRHAAITGCRALDTLHCAVAKLLAPTQFISSDRGKSPSRRPTHCQ